MDATIIWDLEDDSDGNVQHLREHDAWTLEWAVLAPPQRTLRTEIAGLRHALSAAAGAPMVLPLWSKDSLEPRPDVVFNCGGG